MPKVRLLSGKPLLVNGKVALSDDCCCGEGPPPCPLPDIDDSNCPHALCFELLIRQEEIDADNAGDIVDFLGSGRDPSFPLMGLFPVYGAVQWNFYTDSDSLTVTSIITADEWFPVRIEFWTVSSAPKVKITVNGVESTVGNATVADWTGILFGANFSGSNVNHRSIRNIHLTANPDSAEVGFDFPPDVFDSITGSGITVADGVITIDTTGNAYAIKNLDPSYGICADCGEGVPTDDTPSVTVNISGVVSCGCVCANPNEDDRDCSDPGRTHQSIIVTPSFDGEYVLPFREDIDGPIFELIDDTAVVGSADGYDNSADCSDCFGEPCPVTEDLVGIRILVHYNSVDQVWTCFCDVGGGATNPKLYEAIGITTDCWGNGGRAHNQIGCDTVLGTFGTGTMSGGDVDLTW